MTDRWVSVHAFRNADHDPLVTGAVGPLAERLVASGAVDRWFFLRYWEGGSHVRVRVAARPDAVDDVRRTLLDGLGDYLRAHPSIVDPDPTTYAEIARTLGTYERRTDYEPTPRPNNTAVEIPYRPEHHVFGTGSSMDAAEVHFGESSRIALDVLADGVGAGERRGLALSMGLLALAAVEPDLDRVAGWFASGGESARARFTGTPEVERMERAYAAVRERLIDHAHAVWATPPEPAAAGDVLSRWRASIARLATALHAAAAAGDLAVEPSDSPFAWHLDRMPVDRRTVASILLRCAHLANNRLGVAAAQEVQVGFLSARILTDIARG